MSNSNWQSLWRGILALSIMAVLISLNVWAFQRFSNANYFVWYLKNGSLIGIAVGYIALIWEGLAIREDLLSTHPAKYLSGCSALLAVFFYSISVHLGNPLHGSKDKDVGFGLAIILDGLVSPLLLLLMGIFIIAWLLVVAPLNYFVTILSGAIARQELRGTLLRAIVIQEEKENILTSQLAKDKLPDNAVDVSLAKKPFAMTQVTTSFVLWIASTIFHFFGYL